MRYLSTLLKLKTQKELNYSVLPKALVTQLLDEGLIEIKTLSANKKKVLAKEQFFIAFKNIEKIQNSMTRADLIGAKSDTKIKKVSPQDGLYLNGNCKISNITLPIFENSALFLKDIPSISKDILIVCVENFENLIYFKSQLRLFRDEDILFVFRNSAMLKFIEEIENEIIYFGDFDLAGINIYQTQILTRNNSIKFFIPKSIENDLDNYGTKKLYMKQYELFKNIKSEDKKIQNLIDMIHKKQKVLEQEYYINIEDGL